MAENEFDPQKIEDFIARVKNNQNNWKFGRNAYSRCFGNSYVFHNGLYNPT